MSLHSDVQQINAQNAARKPKQYRFKSISDSPFARRPKLYAIQVILMQNSDREFYRDNVRWLADWGAGLIHGPQHEAFITNDEDAIAKVKAYCEWVEPKLGHESLKYTFNIVPVDVITFSDMRSRKWQADNQVPDLTLFRNDERLHENLVELSGLFFSNRNLFEPWQDKFGEKLEGSRGVNQFLITAAKEFEGAITLWELQHGDDSFDYMCAMQNFSEALLKTEQLPDERAMVAMAMRSIWQTRHEQNATTIYFSDFEFAGIPTTDAERKAYEESEAKLDQGD